MLHRLPARQPRHVLLGVACGLLLLLSLSLAVFYSFFAPNRDVQLLSWGISLLLLWPVGGLLLKLFGEQVVQVEHAGVAVSFYLGRFRLRQSVWPARAVLHFDWSSSSDGLFSLRLVLLRRDGSTGFCTVMHTDSVYAIHAVLRDLELHFPGSGLYEERPPAEVPSSGQSRLFSVACILFGLGAAAWLLPQVYRPLRVCAAGRTEPAEVVSVEWGATQRHGSPFHLRVRPLSSQQTVRSATSFYPQQGRVPLPGQKIPVQWAENQPFYLPGEVLSLMMPLPVTGACLLSVWFGIWGLMRSGRRLR